jgi:hypothetical protein
MEKTENGMGRNKKRNEKKSKICDTKKERELRDGVNRCL